MKLKKYFPANIYEFLVQIYNSFFNSFRNNSYSQEGEDLILNKLFDNKTTGFYVDIGAHHPKRFSNTFIFYKKGWQGINIEPNPEIIPLFKKLRPRDINLQVGISDTEKTLTYYMFSEPALNTFSKYREEILISNHNSQLINQVDVQSTTLKKILTEYLKPKRKIDFMTIDVEGFDYQVLNSNDWNKFRPSIVLVEDSSFDCQVPNLSKIYNFMLNVDYSLISKTYKTLFFKDVR